MRYFFTTCLILFGSLLFAEGDVDSILSAIEEEKDPVKKIRLHHEAADAYHDPSSSAACIDQLTQALFLAESVDHDTLIAQTYLKLGRIYFDIENGPASIDNYNKGLLRSEYLTGYEKLRANNSLGIIYGVFSEFDKAVESYKKAISFSDQATAETGKTFEYLYNNVGISYADLREFDSSWVYHQKCLKIRLANEDNWGLGQSYGNIGTLFFKMEEYDSSLVYFQRGLEYRQKREDPPASSMIESEIFIGQALVALKRYSEAEPMLIRCREKSIEISNPILEMRTLEQMILLYKETRKWEKAFEASQTYYDLRDNLFGMEDREEIVRLGHEQVYNQKLKHDSLMRVEKDRLAAVEEAKRAEVEEQKKAVSFAIQIGLGVGLLLAVGLLILAYRSYKQKKKSEVEIAHQRDMAEEQRDIAELQKIQLAEINQEITDSINYAQRIQNAILPSDELMDRILQKYFVLYMPKAIVAGDFYWVHQVDDKSYFAAADCTGHGVPGAMVSVVCSTALNRTIEEYGLRDPGEILNKVAELVVETFEKNDAQVKDGMDISLCCFNRSTGELTFAGANNSVYIYRASNSNLEEVKATRQGVGYVENRIPFETQKIDIEKGDIVYSFTDGFADQFGGPKGKKYKYTNFKNYLLTLHNVGMSEQGEKIAGELKRWMGDLEQVDDVCIIGMKF